MARRGRPKEDGTVFYLGRLRIKPTDPTRLAAFMQHLSTLGHPARQRTLKTALLQGLSAIEFAGDTGEDCAIEVTEQVLADIL